MNKTLELMRRNPQGDWSIKHVESVCREVGASCEPPRSGGSHYKVSHPRSAEILTIPFKRPIKPVYIRKLVTLLDKVKSGAG